jgi:dipeptidyl aminopeptidase/acylaminoacyl peptidase
MPLSDYKQDTSMAILANIVWTSIKPFVYRITSRLRLTCTSLPIFLICVSNCQAQTSQLKPFTPEELLSMEEIGETSLSPDGQLLAYVLKRAKRDGAVDAMGNLNDNEHADVCIVSVTPGTTANTNITKGMAEGAGYWAPRWSPDGQRLAMLSIKHGIVQLYVWTRASKTLELMSARVVSPLPLENFQHPYSWVSDRRIVYVAENPRQQSSPTETAISAWTQAREGVSSSASVLDSGLDASLESRPQRELVMADVASKSERIIATGTDFGEILLSPNRQYLAFLKQVDVFHPDASVQQVTVLNPAIYQLMITDFNGEVRTFETVKEAIQGSLLWSPTSTELALVGYDYQSGRKQIVFSCHRATQACAPLSDKFQDLDPNRFNRFLRPPMTWSGNDELIIFSRTNDLSALGKPKTSRWWAIDSGGRHRELFANQKNQPTQILPELGTANLVAVIAGELCLVGEDGHLIRKIAPGFHPKVTSIGWTDAQSNVTNLRTRRQPSADPVQKLLILEACDNSACGFYLLNIQSGQVRALGKPASNTTVLGADVKAETVTLLADDDTGTRILTSSAATKTLTPIVEINSFLRGIFHPKQQRLQYRGLDGQQLNGWVLLPDDYKEGQKYATIVWVYPSTVYSDKPPRTRSPFIQRNPFDLALLTARGYAVLLPSMPLKAYGEVQDPYMELTKGVLPAIDKLVELGIADPDKVGLFGHSYGGFATYGLVTQTNRFKAAVSSAGMSNFLSLYGIFDPRQRYDDDAHENLMRMWDQETIGMGGPPWKDLGRYLRNSPVNFVERVETALLIIQGDFDVECQLQQGEEFFTGLYRQNKRARFARYFGEPHVIQSPANVRHMWNQIFSWFDEFLKPNGRSSSAGQN